MDGTRFRAWSALALPAASWVVFEQGLSMTISGACVAAGFPLGALWGTASLLMCGIAGWLGWTGIRRSGAADRFLSHLAVWAAGLFALAIAYQTLATAIVPPCAR